MQFSSVRLSLERLRILAGIPCLAWAVGAATLAHAQEGSDEVEEIVVVGWPAIERATAEMQRTAGAVNLIPDSAFKSTPVQHVKDILGFVPGVVTQPRMGDDARISVRGS